MTPEAEISFEHPNFSKGLVHAEMPAYMGERQSGKVRDNWVFEVGGERYRVQVTTDRLSAYDKIICAVPQKGKVLNMISSFWFERTRDIIPNHKIHSPHPNVLIAEPAAATLPVEVVVRRFMAKASTSTSIYHNYMNLGRRNIYGINFPEGLRANQEFPMGAIITPTTKGAEDEHDRELTNEEARKLVDSEMGIGIWDQAKKAALLLFDRGYQYMRARGIIMADTKYEFGIRGNGSLMLIDEIHTPDSSRFWTARTYKSRLEDGQDPESSDKELIRRFLAEHGFKGEGSIPEVPQKVIENVEKKYVEIYRTITDKELPGNPSKVTSIKSAADSFFRSL